MSGEKTEKPTDKRLDDQRKKGQLPQRKNVLEASILTIGTIYIATTWSQFAEAMGDVFDASLSGISNGLVNSRIEIMAAFQGALSYSLIFMIALAVFVLFFNLMLTKFNFAPQAMSPKFEKFNPINGLKGIFSKNTLYNFFRMLIYFVSASSALVFMIMVNLGDIIDASACGLECVALVLPAMILKTVSIILLVLIIMAVMDYKIQTILFINQNKMTKDDIKREHKGSEGDPMVKGARKQIAREDAHMPTLKEVSHVVYSASVLVAVIYHEGSAPFVVMKTKGNGVTRLLQKLRSVGAICVNLPNVANDFYRLGRTGAYLDKRSAKGMALILKRIEEQMG